MGESSKFKNIYATYDATEDPPIITNSYQSVKNNYDLLTHPENLYFTNSVQSNYYQQPQKTNSNSVFNESFYRGVTRAGDELVQNRARTIASSGNSGKIISYFTGKGLTENLARGILGNLKQESGLRLGAVSRDGHNSYGLAQWTGGRKLKLFAKYGNNPTFELQLDFLWEELNTTERRALLSLKNSTSIESATESFMNDFERPHRLYANLKNRIKYAYT